MDNMKFMVKANVFGRENPTPPCYVTWLGLLMADFDTTYGFNGDVVIALLSAYVDALLCNPAIIAFDIPQGKSLELVAS